MPVSELMVPVALQPIAKVRFRDEAALTCSLTVRDRKGLVPVQRLPDIATHGYYNSL